jgi:hypothetical protein
MADAGDGMVEGKLPGVEHEAVWEAGVLGGFGVNWIAEEWGAAGEQVDADLMGATGVEGAEDEGGEGGGIDGEDLVVGDGGLTTGRIDDGHLLAVDRVAADV